MISPSFRFKIKSLPLSNRVNDDDAFHMGGVAFCTDIVLFLLMVKVMPGNEADTSLPSKSAFLSCHAPVICFMKTSSVVSLSSPPPQAEMSIMLTNKIGVRYCNFFMTFQFFEFCSY